MAARQADFLGKEFDDLKDTLGFSGEYYETTANEDQPYNRITDSTRRVRTERRANANGVELESSYNNENSDNHGDSSDD